MRTLIIDKDGRGQYTYRIITPGGDELVPTQYGTFEVESTLEQARGRFSFDEIVNLVK